MEVFCGCFVPVHCVSFVDGVYSAFLGDAHLLSDRMEGGGTLGWGRMNSPRALSKVNPLTPLPVPVVSTRLALAAYIQYPATSISVPGRRTSEAEGFSDVSGSLYIPKIVPTETPASRLEDPIVNFGG